MHHKRLKPACSVLIAAILVSLPFMVEAITWSVNQKQLTFYDRYDGFPALAQAKDGRIWAAWAREVEANLTLYYKISSDQGRTWSEEQNLTNVVGVGENQNPSLLQASNGTIWAVWTSDRLPPPAPPMPDFEVAPSPSSLSIPQGDTDESTIMVTSTHNFSEVVLLSVSGEPADVTATLNPTQVTPPANQTANSTLTVSVGATATPGFYTLTISGRSGHLIRFASIDLEITVAGATSQTPVHDHEVPFPTSAAAAVQDYEIYYKTSHDNGDHWSPALQLTTNTVDDLCPAIIQLTNGTIMIVWQSYTTGNHDILYTTTTDGITWSATTQLTTHAANDKAPAATQAQDGTIWVAWASTRNGDYEIYYNTYNGATWTGDQRLTSNTNSDVQPAIIQAIDETLMIFWATGTPTDDYDIYYKSSSNNGATWSARIPFITTAYEDVWPAVMRARDTRIWVAWYNNAADQPNGNWDVYYTTSLAGDVNGDTLINVIDLTIVSLAYGMFAGEPGYNPAADINKDNFVDMRDLVIVAYYLGET